jgi:hypothetical protein
MRFDVKVIQHERGIALVLALLLTAAASALAVSLMFLSQTETYATMNYRMMSQARFAGEAGIHKAADFLLDSTKYQVPGGGNPLGDSLANYDTTKSPVICIAGCPNLNQPVVLSASTLVSSNYPVAAVGTAFQDGAKGTLAVGNASLSYGSYATLISMQKFDAYGGTQNVVQTWQITGVGTLGGVSQSTVQVEATVETPKVSANSMAAFATSNQCDAIYLKGDVKTDSYDSRVAPPGSTPGAGNSTKNEQGDVGTNGNIHLQGSTDMNGNLYTPRQGVGSCTEGAVVALTETGSAMNVNGDLVHLPAVVNYPTPTMSVVPPTNTVTIDSTLLNTSAPAGGGMTQVQASAANACAQLGLVLTTSTTAGNCDVRNTTGQSVMSGGAGPFTTIVVGTGAANAPDLTLPSVVVGGGITLKIEGASTPGQTVNVNSLTAPPSGGGGSVEIDANLTSGVTDQSVVLKIAGKNPDGSEMAVPFDFEGLSWKQNSTAKSYDASALQIVYGGTQTIQMTGGNSQSAATVYAPNANFILKGTQDFYGSILSKTLDDHGGAGIHYDRRLAADFWVKGHPMMGAFTWKRD